MKSLGLKTITVLALALLAGCTTHPTLSSANQDRDKNTVTEPQKVYPEPTYLTQYPFTKDELWAKILKLTAIRDDAITHKDLETVFDTKLHPVTNKMKGYDYTGMLETTPKKDWYFYLSWYSSSKVNMRSFSFLWNDQNHTLPLPSPPEGMCLDADKLRPSLELQGWIDHSSPYSDLKNIKTYTRGTNDKEDLNLTIDLSTNCLLSINYFYYLRETKN